MMLENIIKQRSNDADVIRFETFGNKWFRGKYKYVQFVEGDKVVCKDAWGKISKHKLSYQPKKWWINPFEDF